MGKYSTMSCSPNKLPVALLFYSILCYLSPSVHAVNRKDVDHAPPIHHASVVQFFIIQTSFPYNAPEEFEEVMGYSFENYDTPHAGLGVWDITEDNRYSIEFISKSYYGALLPELQPSSDVNDPSIAGTINWNNDGRVVISDPVVKSDWISSQLLTTTTGTAYSQLIDYLQDNKHQFQQFQPVTAAYVNSTAAEKYDNKLTTKEINQLDLIKVSSRDSYWFVDKLIKQLTDYGCDVKTFLKVTSTAFIYTTSPSLDSNSVPVVDWKDSSTDDDDQTAVYQWYYALVACYQGAYNVTKESDGGAELFLYAIKDCYGPYAYIYKSDTSVYNVTLGNLNTTYSTPLLGSYIYKLPDDDNGNGQEFSIMDYVFMTTMAIFTVLLLAVICLKLFGKKKRRRVSFEGEKVAARAVELIAGEREGDNSNEFKSYYHGSRYSTSSQAGGLRGSLHAFSSWLRSSLGPGEGPGEKIASNDGSGWDTFQDREHDLHDAPNSKGWQSRQGSQQGYQQSSVDEISVGGGSNGSGSGSGSNGGGSGTIRSTFGFGRSGGGDGGGGGVSSSRASSRSSSRPSLRSTHYTLGAPGPGDFESDRGNSLERPLTQDGFMHDHPPA